MIQGLTLFAFIKKILFERIRFEWMLGINFLEIKQVWKFNFKNLCKDGNVSKRDISFSSFNHSNICPMKSTLSSKSFLAPISIKTKFPYPKTKIFKKCMFHSSKIALAYNVYHIQYVSFSYICTTKTYLNEIISCNPSLSWIRSPYFSFDIKTLSEEEAITKAKERVWKNYVFEL